MDRSKARRALERDLQRHREAPTPSPRTGWIRAIRDALGMSAEELAHRVGLSKARISQIERAERERSLTLHTLDRVATGLGCRVEYVLVPHDPLDDMVRTQARAKATAALRDVDHTMALEDQQLESASASRQIDGATALYIDKRGLWS